MDSQELGKILYEFEEEHAEQLVRIRVDGWILWQIVKPSLFYHFLNMTHFNRPENNEQKDKLSKKGRRKLLSRVGHTARLVLRLIRLNREEMDGVVLSREVAKIEQDEEGNSFDPLLDPIPIYVRDYEFLVMELSFRRMRANHPQRVDPHLKNDGLFLVTTLLRKWTWLRKGRELRVQAQSIVDELQIFFQKRGIRLNLSRKRVEAYLLNFFGEYASYKWFFKQFRLRAAFFTDQIGKGKLAALSKLGVHTIEFQHGLIHRYKKDFIYSPSFFPYKDRMVLPDLIATKGTMFTQALLNSSFWKEEELYTLGGFREETYIQNSRSTKSREVHKRLLFFTQWTMVEDSILTIRYLKPFLDEFDLQLWVKPHPRVTPKYLTRYQNEVEGLSRIDITDPFCSIKGLMEGADLVLSFYSTTLIEALFFGIPCITIGTKGMPNGLHDHLATDHGVQKAIRPFRAEELRAPLEFFYSSTSFQKEWWEDVSNARRSLYEPGYIENLRNLIMGFMD